MTINDTLSAIKALIASIDAGHMKIRGEDSHLIEIWLRHAVNENEVEGEAQGKPIRNFYDLSTAHVSPAARQWLELNAGANAMQRDTAYPVAAFMFGWMMKVPTVDDMDAENVPFDLCAACIEAWLCGCDYMLFDADAERIGTLPVWEEDETSTEGLSEQEIEALKLIHPEDGLPMDERTNAEVIMDSLDPHKPADRRVLLDEESPTFGVARAAAQAAGKAALTEEQVRWVDRYTGGKTE